MNELPTKISPDEVRAIRESLGLSQAAAGELIGGGPRAFAKYESGETKPSASLVKLLLVLYEDRRLFRRVSSAGRPTPARQSLTPKPFAATGSQVSEIGPDGFAELLKRLLTAEVRTNHLHTSYIHVPTTTTAPDGGEDGRISWSSGPDQTRFLPARLCLFQLKTGNLRPDQAAKEVTERSGEIKPRIRKVLEQGGAYVVLCAKRLTQKAIDLRVDRVLRSLRNSGLQVSKAQVVLRDADQVADWANCYPPVAIWFLDQSRPGLTGPFCSWDSWAGRHEHASSAYVEDPRLPPFRDKLLRAMNGPRGVARVVGMSGVGLSRLTLQALGSPPSGEESPADLVIYTSESEERSEGILRSVRSLSESGAQAIVVVDDCSTPLRRQLINQTRHRDSALSLITIEDGNPSVVSGDSILRLTEAPDSVIQGIIRQVALGISSLDRDRLTSFSRGFPKIAIRIAQARHRNQPLVSVLDDDLANDYVVAREATERGVQLRAVRLLSVFWSVKILDEEYGVATAIAPLGRSISAEDTHAVARRLIKRGVAKRYGQSIVIRPKPIALNLAERQWREWTPSRWEYVLTGKLGLDLNVSAARQLALLDTTEVAKDVVRHLCRPNGDLCQWQTLSRSENLVVLSHLAQIDPQAAVDSIEQALDGLASSTIASDDWEDLLDVIEIIAFDSESFESGADLLLRLAADESAASTGTAGERFADLFPCVLGNTAANSDSRLEFLKSSLNTSNARLRVVVDALGKGLKTGFVSRSVGPEIRGSRPPLRPWHPENLRVAKNYVGNCLKLLAQLGTTSNHIGAAARARIGDRIRSLVGFGLIDAVESVVADIIDHAIDWPEARVGLRHFLRFDAMQHDQALSKRVNDLLVALEPRTVADCLMNSVSRMPWDHLAGSSTSFQEREKLQVASIRRLASELIDEPQTLIEHLPQLSRGEQRMTHVFGRAIAEYSDRPLDWLSPIRSALLQAPNEDRNSSLLVGYLDGIASIAPELVTKFKQEASKSPRLSFSLPSLCSALGIQIDDIDLVLSALKSGRLTPYSLLEWFSDESFAKLPCEDLVPLFDYLLDSSSDSYKAGVILLYAYCRDKRDRLDEVHRQVVMVAKNAGKWHNHAGESIAPEFETVLDWALGKGRGHRGTCEVAIELCNTLIDSEDLATNDLIEPLIPTLLRDYPEISWSIIGSAIVSRPQQRWRIKDLLRTKSSDAKRARLITYLDPSVLIAWCKANPTVGPRFLASTVPIWDESRDGGKGDNLLHPIIQRMIDEFGSDPEVRNAVFDNIGSFSWKASATREFSRRKALLEQLSHHRDTAVKIWARRSLGRLREMANVDREDRMEFVAALDL